MKHKVKLPSWFSQWNPPKKPDEPMKTIPKYTKISEIEVNTYSFQPFVAPEADHVEISHVDYDPYSENSVNYVNLVFYKKTEIENPNYEKEYKMYKKAFSIWESQCKQWTQHMKEVEVNDKEQRRKQYEKLKKEFES